MVDSQPMEKDVQRTEMRDVGTETQKAVTRPTSQAQTTPSPSPAFVKENIDVLRTRIKELGHQAKAKATPRKLIYIDSEKEAPDWSMTKGFFDRFSLESTSTSDTRGETHSVSKGQKGLSKGKEPSHLRRSKRLKNRSPTKERFRRKKSKPGERRSEYQETSIDSEYDKEDHLSIFLATAEQEEWPMPIWCKMFCQTLGGAARKWFDDLDPKSMDSFEELSQKFLQEFSQQKRYAKDPIEIHNIKMR
ncbi:reverse transcriptase domain-containing protein [Tanacetum coccineum]